MATDRRTLFRDYMRRLDPTGDPAQAVSSGYYVPPPNAVSQRIATRLELEPASSHLLVGGIGSGKTTELIAIQRKLAEVDDLLAVRVDVPARHRLDRLKPGVLIALAATEASSVMYREREAGLVVGAQVQEALARIRDVAKGYYGDDYPEQGDDEGYWVQGILEEPQLSEDVVLLSGWLGQVNGALPRKLVMLFDGLDRVANLALLAKMLTEDVPALGRAGVGVVTVGPQHLRFSPQRFVESSFETVHLHGAAGIDAPEGLQFLTSVLRARADESILPNDSAEAVVRWSGGVLRDLVAIGRAAGAEAYADGSDAVLLSHVSTAADRFGRDLLFGCTREMAARLKDLVPYKRRVVMAAGRAIHDIRPSFTMASELDQRLLLERLIIEVPGTPVRYVPHPTIVPLIAGLGGS